MKRSIVGRIVLGLALVVGFEFIAHAAPKVGEADTGTAGAPSKDVVTVQGASSGTPIPVTVNGGSVGSATPSIAGKSHPATIGATSAQLAGAVSSRTYFEVVNQDTAVTIACNFGGTAVVHGAGSFDVPPGWRKEYSTGLVPPDQVNCISAAGSVNATYVSN